MPINPLVKAELDNLAIQFPGQSQINLDQYAELYGIKRREAPHHVRRRGIPATKEGKNLYISILDLATYKANRKIVTTGPSPGPGPAPSIATLGYEAEMKRRRGVNQLKERRPLPHY